MKTLHPHYCEVVYFWNEPKARSYFVWTISSQPSISITPKNDAFKGYRKLPLVYGLNWIFMFKNSKRNYHKRYVAHKYTLINERKGVQDRWKRCQEIVWILSCLFPAGFLSVDVKCWKVWVVLKKKSADLTLIVNCLIIVYITA